MEATHMKLLTKEIIAKLEKTPLGSTDGQPIKDVIVKFFTPDSSWTWYAVEGEEQDGDWQFFGLVDGLEKEWGYFTLSELQSVHGKFNLPIERDRYFDNKKVSTETNEIVKQGAN
jgi:hypothetical protein